MMDGKLRDNIVSFGDHHGHVIQRQDGMKARCGGPAICDECAAEALLVGLQDGEQARGSLRAAFDVVKERMRQVLVERWDASHDDEHSNRELAKAASAYAYEAGRTDHQRELDKGTPPLQWPWASKWWKPTTRRRDLVKAAALILAEIERLDRQAERQA